jgi:AcrR family transcriptional regulator
MVKKRKWEINMKKQRIADAAISLFLKKGLANVNLKDIANKVGYSKSSLYSYFDSKGDIFLFLIDKDITKIEKLLGKVRRKFDQNETNILEYFIDNEFGNFLDSKTMTKLLNKQFKDALNMFSDNEELIERVYVLRKKQIELYELFLSEYIEDSKKRDLYSYFLVSILHSLSHYQIDIENPLKGKELVDTTKDFIFNGLEGHKK